MKFKLRGRWLRALLWVGLLATGQRTLAYPMPSSVVLLDLQATGVAAEVQLPVPLKQLDATTNPETLVARAGPALLAHLLAHVHPASFEGQPWVVSVNELRVGAAEQTNTGPCQELTAYLWLRPPAGASSSLAKKTAQAQPSISFPH